MKRGTLSSSSLRTLTGCTAGLASRQLPLRSCTATRACRLRSAGSSTRVKDTPCLPSHCRNLEYCKKCGKQVLRDFHARRRGNKVHDHRTGRPCPACGAKTMHDTIINFGESLPERELEAGFAHGEAADLCVVLGSSLRVTPAADMPLATAERGGRLVIVNLQKTPMDDAAALVIHAKTDDVSAGLAERLGLQPAAFRLTRRMCVRCRAVRPAPGKPVALQVSIEAVDADGLPFSCIQAARLRVSETTVTSYAVDADGSSRQLASSATTKQRPVADTTAVFDMTPVSVGRASAASGTAAVLRWQGVVSAQVQFRGHYAEPVLDLALPLDLCVSAPGGSMSQTTEVATSLLAELEPAAGGASEGGLRGAHGAGRMLHATFDPLGSEGWEALTDGGEVDWSKSAAAVAAERQYKGGQAVTK